MKLENKFKDKIYIDIDKISKKLDILLTEKTVPEYQEKKKKTTTRPPHPPICLRQIGTYYGQLSSRL